MARKKSVIILVITLVVVVALVVILGTKFGSSTSSSTQTDGTTVSEVDTGVPEVIDPAFYVDGEQIDDPGTIITLGTQEIPFDLYRYYYLETKRQMEQSSSYSTSTSGTQSSQSESIDWTTAENQQKLKDNTDAWLRNVYGLVQYTKDNNLTLTTQSQEKIDETIATSQQQLGENFEAYMSSSYIANTDTYTTLVTNQYIGYTAIWDIFKPELLDTFGPEKMMHAKHILVNFQDSTAQQTGTTTEVTDERKAEVKAKVDEIYERIQQGEDFDALLNEYNEDTGEPEEGYYFCEGKMVEEFYTATTNLEVGQISEPVESSYGYHIIKREEPADQTYIENNYSTLLSDALATTDILSTNINSKKQELGDALTLTPGKYYDYVLPENIK